MIQKTFIIHDESETYELLASVKLYSWYNNARTTFAFLSCSNAPHIQIHQVVRVLKNAYPGIKVLAGTQSDISNTEGRCTVRISFFYFDESDVNTCILDYDSISKDEAVEKARNFLKDQKFLKGVLLMPIGGDIGLADFVEGISGPYLDVPFFGGIAGDPVGVDKPEDQKGFIMTDEMIFRGIAMVAFVGKNLHLIVNQQVPWKAVGRELTATVSTENRKSKYADVCISRLDGEKPVDIYKHYLGVDFNSYFLRNVAEFPLILYRNDGRQIVNIPLDVSEEGELFYYEGIKNGDKLRLGYGNPEDFMQKADAGSQVIDSFGAEGMLLFICYTHLMMLKKQSSEEIKCYLRNCVGLNYFYCMGEIYRYSFSGEIQSGSLIAVAMREGEKNETIENKLFKIPIDTGKRDIIPLTERLINFLEVTTNEYDEMAHIAELANKAKSDFLSNMSHEIRTPINAVLGMDEMILRDTEEPKTRKFAENIHDAGNILLSLVNDILDFSKIEAGKMDIIPVEYDARSALNDLLNMVKKRAKDKGLDLNVQIDPRIPCIMRGDVIRLKQVILNIVNNAIKYTNYGSIFVRGVLVGRDDIKQTVSIKCLVIDTGIGIKRQDIPRLFNAFDRIEEERNRAIEGTGLGMNITQRLLQAMGSSLEVDSIYGIGSTFSFTITQEVVDWTPVGEFAFLINMKRRQNDIYRPGFTAEGVRVLVVDDAPMNLQVVEGLLEGTLMELDTAISGADCLSWVQENKYDIILLDYRMPQMDGIETLHAIRNLGGWRDTVPIICLTANAVTGAREQYLKAGFDDYVTKPIKPQILEKVLLQYLPEEKVIIKENLAEDVESEEIAPKDVVIDNRGHVTNSPVPEWLFQSEELDVYYGIQACGGPQRFIANLKEFIKRLEPMTEEIREFYEKEELEGYTIKVHALKSSAALIGFMRLSRLCAVLEKDGDAGDILDINEKTPELFALVDKIMRTLGKIKDYNQGSVNTGDNAQTVNIEVLYKELRQAVNDFDYDKLTGLLESMERYYLSDSNKQKLQELLKAADELDWEKIQEILGEE